MPSDRPDRHGEHLTTYKKNRARILASQNVCGICGREVDKSIKYPDPMSACIDHIIPVSRGGHPSDIENLQLAHFTCNRQKADKLLKDKDNTVVADAIVSNRVLPLTIDWKSYRSRQ